MARPTGAVLQGRRRDPDPDIGAHLNVRIWRRGRLRTPIAAVPDGFAIGPAVAGVAEDHSGSRGYGSPSTFDYRARWSFPVEASAGKIVGTFAMYYRDPREGTPRDLDLAAAIARAAAIMISPQLADQ